MGWTGQGGSVWIGRGGDPSATPLGDASGGGEALKLLINPFTLGGVTCGYAPSGVDGHVKFQTLLLYINNDSVVKLNRIVKYHI